MNAFRYFVVGGVAACVDFGLFFVAVMWFGVDWFPAAAVSFVAATAVNYLLSVVFVFESGVRSPRCAFGGTRRRQSGKSKK